MKMNLREAEEMLVERIRILGLKRVIYHAPGISYKMVTTVYLVPLDEDMLVDTTKMDTKALGIARCHHNDQFCRRKGRVLATARALTCFRNDWISCSGRTYVDRDGVENEVPKRSELS